MVRLVNDERAPRRPQFGCTRNLLFLLSLSLGSCNGQQHAVLVPRVPVLLGCLFMGQADKNQREAIHGVVVLVR